MRCHGDIITAFRKNPDLTYQSIADMCGYSKRTVRRILTPIRKGIKPKRSKIPKILLFDIETLPLTVFVWFLGKQRIPFDNVIKDWCILSWSAKYLFDHNVMSDVLTSEESINRDDKRLMKGIWDLLNEADIILAHNAERFDVRKLNARFLLHGFNPPMPYQVIDTLRVTQKMFATPSHRLDDLNSMLGIEKKIPTSYGLWKKCADGNKEALAQMVEYNRNDTLILEELYMKIRPWVRSHPNLGLYMETDESVCPSCASEDLEEGGRYYTMAGRFIAYRCIECGAICRSRYSDVSKEEKEKLLVGVAR